MHNKIRLCDRIDPVVMSMPMCMSVICESIIKNVPINIEEGIMKWKFIPLSINDFDAILGMDGLSRYQANVDYCHWFPRPIRCWSTLIFNQISQIWYRSL